MSENQFSKWWSENGSGFNNFGKEIAQTAFNAGVDFAQKEIEILSKDRFKTYSERTELLDFLVENRLFIVEEKRDKAEELIRKIIMAQGGM